MRRAFLKYEKNELKVKLSMLMMNFNPVVVNGRLTFPDENLKEILGRRKIIHRCHYMTIAKQIVVPLSDVVNIAIDLKYIQRKLIMLDT